MRTPDQGAEYGRGEAQAKALAYEIAAERAYYEFRRMNGQLCSRMCLCVGESVLLLLVPL